MINYYYTLSLKQNMDNSSNDYVHSTFNKVYNNNNNNNNNGKNNLRYTVHHYLLLINIFSCNNNNNNNKNLYSYSKYTNINYNSLYTTR